MQMNVRGINKIDKFDKIKALLNQLKYKNDLIVLGETKIKKRFPINLLNIPGYDKILCMRQSNNGGGGLLVFYKKDLTIYDIKQTSTSHEKITFIIEINGMKIKFVMYYRPPLTNNFKHFLEDLEKEIADYEDEIIILGDINVHTKDDSRDACKYKNLLTSYNLEITNDQITRNVSKRIIDHVVCSDMKNSLINNTISMPNEISDHNMLITTVSNMQVERKRKLVYHEKICYHQLVDNFSNLKWKFDILNQKDPNEITKQLTQLTQETIKRSKIRFRLKQKENFILPWYNTRVIKALEIKNHWSKKYRNSRKNKHVKLLFIKHSKRLKIIMKEEKLKHQYEYFYEKNQKRLWKNINEYLGRNNSNEINAIRKSNGELISNKKKIGDIFNEHFVNSIDDLVRQTVSTIPPNFFSINQSIVLENVTLNEIEYIICTLKNSSPGYDNVKPQVIKKLIGEISPYICHLVNQIFITGVFPENLKLAIVVPINKSGDKLNYDDYRPVSILSVFSKIIEKIIYDRIYKFVNDYLKILYNRQYGFRRRSNTETAAIELVNAIRSGIDDQKIVTAVTMDMKKCFDTVDITMLLQSIEAIGIRGNALKIIESFLSNRKQIVKIGNEYSTTKTYNRGVVQGSTIGSLLFILFFNYLSKLKLNGQLFLYADDILILNFHDKKEDIKEKIQNDVNVVMAGVEKLRLIINKPKTQFIIFHSTKSPKIEEIEINEHMTILRSKTIKYLGLILDEHLKFNEHINYIEAKLSSVAGILWKLRRKLPQHIKKKIYFTLFQCHLNYMCTIWGTASDNAIESLQKVQNRALRNVFDIDRRTNRVKMYTHLVENCLPIRALNFISTGTYVFNNLHNKIHSNIIFSKSNNPRKTRSEKGLVPSSARTNYGKKDITCFGIKVFNSLPSDIRQLNHTKKFKWVAQCYIREENFMEMCLSSDYLKKFG